MSSRDHDECDERDTRRDDATETLHERAFVIAYT
jgi:hypothetical protein